MHKRGAMLTAAVAAFSVEAVAVADIKPPTGADAGKISFRTVCASCHGQEARGDGPVAESLKTKPANLRLITRRRSGTFPEDEIKQFIDGRKVVAAHGPREMPVWGDDLATAVTDAQEREHRRAERISELVAYLKTIQE